MRGVWRAEGAGCVGVGACAAWAVAGSDADDTDGAVSRADVSGVTGWSDALPKLDADALGRRHCCTDAITAAEPKWSRSVGVTCEVEVVAGRIVIGDCSWDEIDRPGRVSANRVDQLIGILRQARKEARRQAKVK